MWVHSEYSSTFVYKIRIEKYRSSLKSTYTFVVECSFTFSVLVANPRKLLYTAANPGRGLLNRDMYVYMYDNHLALKKIMDQPSKVANPARGQLDGK